MDKDSDKTANSWRAAGLLALLTACYTIGFIDRQVLNLMVQPIKQAFALSDVQISLLQGVAFSCGYLLLSPVFGRWVDVGNRLRILATASGAWSLCTALAGCSRGFMGLLGARLGLGAAEAGISPASWSVISDLFPERQLPMAFGVFFLAPYVGGGLALLMGGSVVAAAASWDLSGWPLLSAAAPWQLVFLIFSVPGLLVAALLLWVNEPIRRQVGPLPGTRPTATATFSSLWRGRSFYGNFYVGMACAIIPLYAFPAWMPGFLMRHFGAPIEVVGAHWGIVTLAAGSAGMLIGPLLASFIRNRGVTDVEIRFPIACSIGLAASCLVLHFSKTMDSALTCAGFAILFNSAPLALAATALQRASPAHMRGTTAALYSIVVMISGLAAAPAMVAFLTDYVYRDESRVGDSLAWVCGVAGLVGALLLWRSLRPYIRLSPGRAAAT